LIEDLKTFSQIVRILFLLVGFMKDIAAYRLCHAKINPTGNCIAVEQDRYLFTSVPGRMNF